jgi:hypothetical protein
MRKFFVSVVSFFLFCAVQQSCMAALASVPGISPEQERQLSQKSWTGIFQQIEDDLYRIKPDRNRPGGYTAYNQRQACRAGFTILGLELGLNGSSQPFSLYLKGIGHGDRIKLPALNRITRSKEDTTRVTYQRQDGVTEWYSNRPEGVEQGFIVQKPLTDHQNGPLQVHLAIRQPWQIEVADNQFRFRYGKEVLSYQQLKAWDSKGISLPTRMQKIDNHTLALVVEDLKATYPLYIDPVIQTTQIKKLTNLAEGELDDAFGYSVAIDGELVAVGIPFDDVEDNNGMELTNAGSAYVFQRDSGGPGHWGFVCKLVASDRHAVDSFGASIAISGGTIVVGAPNHDKDTDSDAGAAYVFEYYNQSGGQREEIKKLIATSDWESDAYFGNSVATNGDLIVIGAFNDEDNGENSGSVYLFQRNTGGNDNWGQIKKLTATDGKAYDNFGYSVAIGYGNIVVGADYDDINTLLFNAGSAYVFGQNNGGPNNWGQVKKLISEDGARSDYFGHSVAIYRDHIVIGAPGDDDCSGSAYLFQRNLGGSDNWGQLKKLTAPTRESDDYFGLSVAISGLLVVIGAPQQDVGSATQAGSAYIFWRGFGDVDNWWGQVKKLTAADVKMGDWFGFSVAIFSDTAIIGSYQDDIGTKINMGSSYLFKIEFVEGKSHLWFPVKAANGKTVIIGM